MKFKRALALVLTIALMLSVLVLPASAASASFTDVKGHWAEESIIRWAEAGVINGFEDGTFKPDDNMKRGEFAKVLSEVLGLTEKGENTFSDLDDHWAENYVLRCAGAGIMQGYQGKANPEAYLTRAEAFAMVVRTLGAETEDDTVLKDFTDAKDHWAIDEGAVQAIVAYKAIIGYEDNTIRLEDKITRAEVMKLLDRLVAVYVDAKGNVSTTTDAEDNTVGNYVVVNAACTAEVSAVLNEKGEIVVTVNDETTTITVENGQTPTLVEQTATTEIKQPAAESDSEPSPEPSPEPDPEPSPEPSPEPAHTHAYGEAKTNENGTHTKTCANEDGKCDAITVVENCTYIENTDKCDVCSYSDGYVHISTVEQLKDFRDAVNAGDDYSGKTVKLMADLDLNNEVWTPIGATKDDGTHSFFQGAFDGQNHTISNLKMEGVKEDAGLFGYLGTATVQKLNLETVSITGSHSAGAVAGTAGYGAVIENCNVKNVVITLTPDEQSGGAYDNGDDAGAIVGILNGYQYKDTSVLNCSAENVTIKAYRDVGGIVGTANAADYQIKVTGCVVNGLAITVDQVTNFYGAKDINAAGIVGRSIKNVDTSNSNAANVTMVQYLAEGYVLNLVSGEYEVSSVTGLKAFRDAVNAGNNYSGKTVKLMADLDLNNEPWTPIGPNADAANKFQGTFEGNGKTISNLKVQQEAAYHAAGLFGALNGTAKNLTLDGVTVSSLSSGDSTDNGTAAVAGSIYSSGLIENVTVKNAEITGNRYVGGISGYTYGSVKNCTVENATITANADNLTGSYDNGDKVGAIAGYFPEDLENVVSGNMVKTVTVKAHRDFGGVVGAGYATGVTNNKVNGLTLTVLIANYDAEANHKDLNKGEIIGRVLSGSLDNSNTAENVTGN